LYLWNLFENLFDDPLNLGTILILMLVWSFLYLPLTWYIEKIMPGQFGIPLPFYFIVSVKQLRANVLSINGNLMSIFCI